MPLASILVVESDPSLRTVIADELRDLGHQVSESEDASSALRTAEQACPDLMVCDFALPDLDGVELLSDVRRSERLKRMRVLMTSGGDSVEDVVLALTGGADDFVGKPIALPELVARVSACLRRPANIAESRVVEAAGIAIDAIGHRVTIDGECVDLAPREYQLLLFLIGHPDRVFSRKQLLVHVWDRDLSIGPRTVDVHIRRLRSVLETYGYDGFIQTVRGAGYRFSLVGAGDRNKSEIFLS